MDVRCLGTCVSNDPFNYALVVQVNSAAHVPRPFWMVQTRVVTANFLGTAVANESMMLSDWALAAQGSSHTMTNDQRHAIRRSSHLGRKGCAEVH